MEKEQKYYELYHCKEKHEMRIRPLRKIFDKQKDNIVPDTIYYHNSNYLFSTNRKILKGFALEMLENWREELNSIKI
jgi:hypothetical protein